MHQDCTTAEFETIARAAIFDALCAAVDAARVASAGNPRWLNAINAAWEHLLSVETVEYRHHDHALSYRSESGKLYIANGRCQCEAFRNSIACKHRAAARLVFRALELHRQTELDALAAELVTDAHDAGATWYGLAEGQAGATLRIDELVAFAAEWDAEALERRIGAAQARTMAQAA